MEERSGLYIIRSVSRAIQIPELKTEVVTIKGSFRRSVFRKRHLQVAHDHNNISGRKGNID